MEQTIENSSPGHKSASMDNSLANTVTTPAPYGDQEAESSQTFGVPTADASSQVQSVFTLGETSTTPQNEYVRFCSLLLGPWNMLTDGCLAMQRMQVFFRTNWVVMRRSRNSTFIICS
jgi:hypothetical protein